MSKISAMTYAEISEQVDLITTAFHNFCKSFDYQDEVITWFDCGRETCFYTKASKVFVSDSTGCPVEIRITSEVSPAKVYLGEFYLNAEGNSDGLADIGKEFVEKVKNIQTLINQHKGKKSLFIRMSLTSMSTLKGIGFTSIRDI